MNDSSPDRIEKAFVIEYNMMGHWQTHACYNSITLEEAVSRFRKLKADNPKKRYRIFERVTHYTKIDPKSVEILQESC